MNRKELARIKKRIASLYGRGGVGAGELQSLLASLGRTRTGTAWRSERFSHLRPITVHPHPGDLNKHTKNGILEDMEADVVEWAAILEDGDDDAEEIS